LQVGLEDPGTTGPDGPAIHQRGGTEGSMPQAPSGLFFDWKRESKTARRKLRRAVECSASDA